MWRSCINLFSVLISIMKSLSIFITLGSCWFSAFILIDGANILFIAPFFSRSHFAFNNIMATNLLNSGHKITIITSLPQQKQQENYTVIEIPHSTHKSDQTNHLPVSKALEMSTKFSVIDMLVEETEQDCYNVMEMHGKEILRSKPKLFDLIFIDVVPIMYECFLPIADTLDIPVIGTIAARSWRNTEWSMGNPYNPAHLPFEMSDFSSKMNFMKRVTNLWHCIFDYFNRYSYIYPKLAKFYEIYFPNLKEMHQRRPSLVFVNGHLALMPRPLVPNIINVGGIHVPPVKRLPKDLKEFIEEAKDGVILFTVGSTLQSHSMPKNIVAVFRNVFSRIRQRVIWKSEESIDNISPNVLISKWLPQRDILAHKNVVAFITHCGISGIYEAIYSEIPLILMPIIFDEMSNAALLENMGAGIRLNWSTLDEDQLLQALNKVIYDPRYKRKIQELSLQFKDQPMSPHELVVYWTEYVLKYDGAKHLNSAAIDLPLYQYLYLDAYLWFLVIFVGIVWLLIRVIIIPLN